VLGIEELKSLFFLHTQTSPINTTSGNRRGY